MDTFLDKRFNDKVIGRIGFEANLANLGGALLVPMMVDAFKLQRQLKTILVPIYLLCTGCMGLFTYIAFFAPNGSGNSTYGNHSNSSSHNGTSAGSTNIAVVGATNCAVAFVAGAIAPITLELMSEISFPVSEETSTSYTMMLLTAIQIGLMEGTIHAV